MQVALVTGYGSGLGRVTADTLVSAGWIVYATDKSKPTVKGNQKNLIASQLDVTDSKSCTDLIDNIISEQNHIDALINVAGMTLVGSTLGFSTDDFETIIKVNTIGPFRLIKLVYSAMKERKSGRIVNITSLNGLVSLPGYGLYGASKFATEALGTALSFELRKDNVFVTNVAPGAIKDSGAKANNHAGLRERSIIFKKLLPMVTCQEVADKITQALISEKPPQELILGRDAKVTYLLYKYLPRTIWNYMLSKLLV